MPDEDPITLHEAAALYNIDSDELYLAIHALEASQGHHVHWSVERRSGTVVNVYRRSDCEAAVALRAAKDLGFVEE